MNQVDRRNFLKLAGAGTAVAAAALLPGTGLLSWVTGDVLKFRAVTGLPKKPLPAYASLVIEGNVDLDARTGLITQSLIAGAPGATSNIAFPGTARSIQVTNVRRSRDTVEITGVADSAEILAKGESREVTILINRSLGTATATFFGHEVVLAVD